ncbi:MAG: ribbon-helix-helix domain-containing protein [Acidobacteria bacterium]|nr:ribbon-helix-helix domain-containing protein [Acidobacteriota bacterium]
MKTIQITIDEELLARLDKTEEVRQIGRSAVLRRAASDYLDRQSRIEIARQYQKAYGANANLGKEFKGWEGEAAWMEE